MQYKGRNMSNLAWFCHIDASGRPRYQQRKVSQDDLDLWVELERLHLQRQRHMGLEDDSPMPTKNTRRARNGRRSARAGHNLGRPR